jgi:ribonuclease VapC
VIVVDTSVVIAILGRERDAARLARTLAADQHCQISVVNFVEAATVAQRWGDAAATATLDEFMANFRVNLAAVDQQHAQLARQAYLQFGKGRGHPAQLNICDCFSYALAKSLDAPLLFKGDDFSKTDIKSALDPQ